MGEWRTLLAYKTFILTYCARDAAADQSFPIEWAIASLSRRPAAAVGLNDRGLLAPGMKADTNIIDLDRLKLFAPRTAYDLPSAGRRCASVPKATSPRSLVAS